MNKREKIIAAVVGSVLVLIFGKMFISAFFINPLRTIKDDISVSEEKIDKINNQLKSKSKLIRDWNGVKKRMLSEDSGMASLLLRSRVTMLTEKVGLQVTVTPMAVNSVKTGGEKSFDVIAINLSGRGTISQIVQFMELLYNEPYMVKVTALSLRPEDKGDQISFSNCRVESIVLGKPVTDSSFPKVSLMEITSTQPAVQLAAKSPYSSITSRNIFKPFELPKPKPVVQVPPPRPAPPPPPPPVVVQQVPNRPGVSPPVAPAPTPGGRPGDVVGIVVVGEKSGAYIRNQTACDLYKTSDQLPNGMKIVYLHPLGIVMSSNDNKLMYVESGSNLDKASALTKEAFPELYQEYTIKGKNEENK
jgi:hypothetical protein